jgi:hypothetical protein
MQTALAAAMCMHEDKNSKTTGISSASHWTTALWRVYGDATHGL